MIMDSVLYIIVNRFDLHHGVYTTSTKLHPSNISVESTFYNISGKFRFYFLEKSFVL